MKNYERRRVGKEAYFKLATWDAGNFTWRDGKQQYDSETEARAAATKPGRYRISHVFNGRHDLDPFVIS